MKNQKTLIALGIVVVGLLFFSMFRFGYSHGVDAVAGKALYPYDPKIELKESRSEMTDRQTTLSKVLSEKPTMNSVVIDELTINYEGANITLKNFHSEIDSRIIFLITMLEGGY